MKWIALFSQTGSEICEVSKEIGRWPDWVVTNKENWDDINPELIDHTIISYVPDRPDASHYKAYLRKHDTIITLNGWLRIVPPEICDEYEIYNGHPGLITTYPELKGKDPQQKAFDLKMEYGGCVIHDVVSEVDAGKILAERTIPIKDLSLDKVYSALHNVSVHLWVDFLKGKLN